MRITTLGTSHGDHTYCRFNSCTLFESNENSILIDAGAPVDGLMIRKKKRFDMLKAVFITHLHIDHSGGLPALIKSVVKHPVNGQHTKLFLPEDGLNAIKPWLMANHLPVQSPYISYAPVTEGLLYNDGVFSVSAAGTRHIQSGEAPRSFAYIIESEGKKILYSGDLRSDFSDFPVISQQEYIDLCICESTHYKPESAIPYLQKSRFGKLIFNHVYDTWHGEGEEKLKSYFAGLPYPIEVAHDGDEFVL